MQDLIWNCVLAIFAILAVWASYWGGRSKGYRYGRAVGFGEGIIDGRTMSRLPAPPRTRDPWRMTPEETLALAVNPEPAGVQAGGQFVPETPAIGDRRIVQIVALDPPLYRLDQYDECDNRFARWTALPVGRGRNGLFETHAAAALAMMGPKTVAYSRVSVAVSGEPDTGAADFPDEGHSASVTTHQSAPYDDLAVGATSVVSGHKIGHFARERRSCGDGKMNWYVYYGNTEVAGPFTTQEDAQDEVRVLDGKGLR